MTGGMKIRPGRIRRGCSAIRAAPANGTPEIRLPADLLAEFLFRFLEPALLRDALFVRNGLSRRVPRLAARPGDDHDREAEDGKRGDQREERDGTEEQARAFGLRPRVPFPLAALGTAAGHGPHVIVRADPAAGLGTRQFALVPHGLGSAPQAR